MIVLGTGTPAMVYGDIDDSSIPDLIDGYMEKKSLPHFGVDIWFDEDGIRKDLPFNFHASIAARFPIKGPAVITGPPAHGSPTSVTPEQYDEIVSYFPKGG